MAKTTLWSMMRKLADWPVTRGARLANGSESATAAAPLYDKSIQLEQLARLLIAQGQCDARTIARANSMAGESGETMDVVLIQLGLVSERGLAQAYTTLLGCPLAGPERYPAMEPLLPDVLPSGFLRRARAVPVELQGSVLTVVLADPLDAFTIAAITAATGFAVVREVALPIEIDAALDRLYPDSAGAPADAAHAGPLEEDTERLKDLASEAPVIRLVNQIIFRAVETQASDKRAAIKADARP